MIRGWLHRALAHPETRGLNLDDPCTTEFRRSIILQKPFLREIYRDWYRFISNALPPGDRPVLELGSGAGFLQNHVPRLITSEVMRCPEVDLLADGCQLPFGEACLRGIVMVDVFHHISNVRLFLAEAARCVEPDGRMVMVEPWATCWSRLVYTHLHHEPFDPDTPRWSFPAQGPLSSANSALPWIVFQRDITRFKTHHPEWSVEHVTPIMPLRYLISGGVSMRGFLPASATPLFRAAEVLLKPVCARFGMFAQISLKRV